MKTIIRLAVLFLLAGLVSCKKDASAGGPVSTQPAPVTTGLLKLSFNHVVDSLPLVFNTNYVDPKGDTFRVSKFNYFVSNIVFTRADNSTYTEPNSYHVVRHSDPASQAILLGAVPFGTYTAVSFMLGVDSARNVSGAQSGGLDLATAGDMYWDWNSGYIFFKLEGASPRSGDAQKNLTYHIGGYGGINKGQRLFHLGFNGALATVANNGGASVVQLQVNVNEFFKTPTLIDVSAPNYYDHTTVNATNKILADNYADMISFGHIQNF